MSVKVTEMIARLLGIEGGYANHRSDRGGPTRWGITQAVARAYGYTGEMRVLPQGTAIEIYRKRYWLEPGLDQIAEVAPALAAELFDTGVNMGTATAITFLQRALNVLNRRGRDYADISADGRIGTVTLAALRAFLRVRGTEGERVLILVCDALQGARYVAIAEADAAQETFVFGWIAKRTGVDA